MRSPHTYLVLSILACLLAGCGGSGPFTPPPAGGTVILSPTPPISLRPGQSVVVIATTTGNLRGTDVVWQTTAGSAVTSLVSASASESRCSIQLPLAAQGDSTVILKTVAGSRLATVEIVNVGQ